MYKEDCVAKFLKNVHTKPKTFYMDALGNDVFKDYELTLVGDRLHYFRHYPLSGNLFISIDDINRMIQRQFYKRRNSKC